MEELIAQQCEIIGQLQAEAEETAKSHRDAIDDWRERSLALKFHPELVGFGRKAAEVAYIYADGLLWASRRSS